MSKLKLGGMEFAVDEIVYDGEGVAVYVCGKILTIDDGTNQQNLVDTKDNRIHFTNLAKELERVWESEAE